MYCATMFNMNSLVNHREYSVEDIKRKIFQNTSFLLDEIAYLHEVLKAVNREIVHIVLNDKGSTEYNEAMTKYKKIQQMVKDLNSLKNDSLGALRPIAELQKSETLQDVTMPQKPLLIDVST